MQFEARAVNRGKMLPLIDRMGTLVQGATAAAPVTKVIVLGAVKPGMRGEFTAPVYTKFGVEGLDPPMSARPLILLLLIAAFFANGIPIDLPGVVGQLPYSAAATLGKTPGPSVNGEDGSRLLPWRKPRKLVSFVR